MGNLGDLKAQQLVLLAVFVSFITSVATGITTVSLIEAAPAPVQQVVNRVVERTVERVVPEEKPDEDKPVEKEVVTVVVKEEDLLIGAADSVGKSVARIFVKGTAEFACLGLVVGQNEIVSDSEMLALDGEYDVEVNGVRAVARVTRENGGFALLTVPAETPAFSPATIGSASSLKLAQSLIAVAGKVSPAVATGALVSLSRADAASPVTAIEASLSGAEILPGTPLANIRGEVVGLRAVNAAAPGFFATAEAAAAFAKGA
jgi:hypothetical protein